MKRFVAPPGLLISLRAGAAIDHSPQGEFR